MRQALNLSLLTRNTSGALIFSFFIANREAIYKSLQVSHFIYFALNASQRIVPLSTALCHRCLLGTLCAHQKRTIYIKIYCHSQVSFSFSDAEAKNSISSAKGVNKSSQMTQWAEAFFLCVYECWIVHRWSHDDSMELSNLTRLNY